MTLLRRASMGASLALLAASAVLAGVEYANATDIYDGGDAPSAREPAGWTAPWIGVGFGGGAAAHGLSLDVEDHGEIASLDGVSGEGVFGSIEAGHDWQAGRSVFGVTGSLSGAPAGWGLETEASLGGDSATFEKRWGAMLGVRAALVVAPDTIAGIHGGWAWADYESDPDGLDQTYDGPWGGGFVETRIHGSPWRVRADYRYADYGEETLGESGALAVNDDLSEHLARVVFTYAVQ